MNATLKPPDSTEGARNPFQDLFDDVEDLIKRVAEVDSPEIQNMRAKARVALLAARSALKDGASVVRNRARSAADATDSYVRTYPWQALGLGVLLGLALGLTLRGFAQDSGDSPSDESD